MAKVEVVCTIITVVIFGIAIKLLSDRIAERKVAHRELKTAIAVGFGLYDSIAIAIILEDCYVAEFKVWEVALLSFSILCIYIGTAVIVGMYKRWKDECRKIKNASCYDEEELHDSK